MNVHVVIPARYASSRLPGKVLEDVCGKPLVQWTWENACRSGANQVVIATESEAVKAACEAFGAEVCMTSPEHASGTERLGEVIDRFGWAEDDIVVNVQADEPMLPPILIQQVAKGLAETPGTPMATLCEPFAQITDVFDPHMVKVVRDQTGHAITFSRAPVPWDRDAFVNGEILGGTLTHYRRHIGIYAYRAGFLQQYLAWPESPLEQVEKLEQLRVLYHGEKILVLDALEDAGIGVDTQEDLEQVRKVMCTCG